MENNSNSIKFHFTNSRFAPDDATKGLFLFLIFQTLVTLVYQALYLVGLQANIWSLIFTLILDFCFVACVFSVSKEKKINVFSNIKVKKAPNFKEIAICIAISVICLFGFSSLTNLFLEVLYKAGYSSVTSDIVIPNFGTYLLYVGLICIVPALCEEILFRGLICNGLKKMGTFAAVFGSAFLFMIMHGSPDQTVHQFILGIILALVYLVSNNLWVPIIIHFLNNFMAVTISYLAYGDSAATTTESANLLVGDYIVYAIISAAVSFVLIYVLIKALSRSHEDKNAEVEPIELKANAVYSQDGRIDYFNANYANELNTPMQEETQSSGDQVVDPVFKVNENKLSGTGKAMLIVSVVWLVIDWVSALIVGFSGMY